MWQHICTVKDYDKELLKEAMCEDIRTERKRIGGDLAKSVAMNKDLMFVVLNMEPEDVLMVIYFLLEHFESEKYINV